MKKGSIDPVDIRILSALQRHGQLSKNKLAEVVNLSPTPCWARLERLKAAGFIRGYHADVALERVCDFTEVVVTLSLTHHRKSDFERFETHVRQVEEVVECVATGGGTDYVLKFVTASLADFQNSMDSLLNSEIGIDRYVTHFVTRRVKTGLPGVARLAGKTGK